MKLFTRILTILILPLILIGGVNYCIDPDYSLRNNYITPLVKALLDGKMISGPVNVNSRLLKKQWIEQLTYTPDVLVLGSSHTLSITGQAFPRSSFFNASVSNCTFQDMYAFLNLFEKKQKKLPQTIIICADQWLFGNSFIEKQWLVNRSEAIEMAQNAGITPSKKFRPKWDLDKEWIKELFSVRYLLRSIRNLGKTGKFEICQSIDINKMMFLPDGSRWIPERIINASEKDVSDEANNYFYSSKDEYFTELDQLQCELFEGMIKYIAAGNCKIILFIPPYHPETYQLLGKSNQTSGVFKAESYLRTFAQKHNLRVIGGTNPDFLNLSSLDFYDGVHLKPETLGRIFKNNEIN